VRAVRALIIRCRPRNLSAWWYGSWALLSVTFCGSDVKARYWGWAILLAASAVLNAWWWDSSLKAK
jgi:hypothetical protein